MDANFFLRGFLFGLSIAASVGPMSLLCIQRTCLKDDSMAWCQV